MAIPVDELRQVTAARCISCMSCIEECPTRGAGALTWGPPGRVGRSWPQAALLAVLLLCATAAVAASYAFPLPSFVKSRGDAPATTAVVRLQVHDLTCRGRATLLVYYLERDDEYEVPGYLKLEAWPGPGLGEAQVTYDPAQTEELAVKEAITEPYFDLHANFWRPSPFKIEGYDPLDMVGDEPSDTSP
jgi:ferredoxin